MSDAERFARKTMKEYYELVKPHGYGKYAKYLLVWFYYASGGGSAGSLFFANSGDRELGVDVYTSIKAIIVKKFDGREPPKILNPNTRPMFSLVLRRFLDNLAFWGFDEDEQKIVLAREVKWMSTAFMNYVKLTQIE